MFRPLLLGCAVMFMLAASGLFTGPGGLVGAEAWSAEGPRADAPRVPAAPRADEDPFDDRPSAAVRSARSSRSSARDTHRRQAAAPPGAERRTPRPVRAQKESPRSAERRAKGCPLSAERRILDALRSPASLDFIDTPLRDIVDHLGKVYEINVVLNERALEDVGIPSDTPINKRISNLSLQSALNLMLGDLDLTWTIENEALMITTPEEAEAALVTTVYEVSDLVICRDKSGKLWADYDTLIDMIQTTIEPETWGDVGGPGAITGASFRGTEVLVISQTLPVHWKVDELLNELGALVERQGRDAEPPPRDKPAPPSMGGMGGMGFGGVGFGGMGMGGMGMGGGMF